MYEHYEVTRGVVVTTDGFGHAAGSLVSTDKMDPSVLADLISDGTLIPNGTDTGKTPPKQPHPEDVGDVVMTKVIEPTVKKGKGK